MPRALMVAALYLGGLLAAAPARAQVESHYLPREWPVKLLPRYVEDPPRPATQELSAPLLSEKIEEEKVNVAAGQIDTLIGEDPADKGKPDATTLADMWHGPKKVIELTFKKEYQQAADAGRKVLEKPKRTYGDFTWDYVASATAWSLIHLGRYDAAMEAHRAGVSRIGDADVRQYHLRYAAAVKEVLEADDKAPDAPKPGDLKKPETVREILRKALRDEVKQIVRSLELMRKAKTLSSRLGNLNAAYGRLRLIMAIDPDVAGRILADFKSAADTLVEETADKLLASATAQHQVLQRMERISMRKHQVGAWNKEVVKLWSAIADVKRVARIHNYLERLNLAGAANAAAPFNGAHDLLFAPGGREVYKTCGGTAPGPWGGVDLKRRAPIDQVPSLREGL